jgi:hypothetical protein
MKVWDWIEIHRLFSVIIVMLIIWFSLLAFWYMKADEVTKHPCSICAVKMGENVICRTGTTNFLERTFYSDGSINDSKHIDKSVYPSFNASAFEKLIPK